MDIILQRRRKLLQRLLRIHVAFSHISSSIVFKLPSVSHQKRFMYIYIYIYNCLQRSRRPLCRQITTQKYLPTDTCCPWKLWSHWLGVPERRHRHGCSYCCRCCRLLFCLYRRFCWRCLKRRQPLREASTISLLLPVENSERIQECRVSENYK